MKQYFRYVAGRPETPADRPVINRLLDDFRNSQFHFQGTDHFTDPRPGISGCRRRRTHVASNH